MKDIINIAKILKPHGIKGAVKIQPLVDDDMPFSIFKKVFVGDSLTPANIVSIINLNNAYAVTLDIIKNTIDAEVYRGQYISVDRNMYHDFFGDNILVADLLGATVVSTEGELVGYIVDVEQYGSADVLTINCNGVSYQIPYVKDIIWYGANGQFVINKKRFLEVRV